MKKGVMICLLALFFSQLYSLAFADDAEVLPKGVFRLGVETEFYFPVEERYNPDGDVEDVAVDYSKPLDSNVFPDLGLIEQAFGMPSGSATVGSSVVSFEYQFILTDFSLAYGLTDRLTVGIILPYWWQENKVKAELNNTAATVGKNAAANMLLPLGVPGTVPLTTDDVQNLLGKGLDINGDGTVDIPGYGYKRVETWSGSGIADIQIGARYQYLKTDKWRLAFTGGVTLPTGEVDEPDNLVDYPFGDGAYALLFRMNNDFTGIKRLLLNATLRYNLILPDKETKRVPDSVDQPITLNKEKVDRNLGDIFEFEASAKYELAKGFDISALYKYGSKQKDDISGDKGYAYKSLEDETDYTEHIFIVGLSYSTVPLYMEKKFSVPFRASLSYRNRFAGSNNVLKSQYIKAGLQVFF